MSTSATSATPPPPNPFASPLRRPAGKPISGLFAFDIEALQRGHSSPVKPKSPNKTLPRSDRNRIEAGVRDIGSSKRRDENGNKERNLDRGSQSQKETIPSVFLPKKGLRRTPPRPASPAKKPDTDNSSTPSHAPQRRFGATRSANVQPPQGPVATPPAEDKEKDKQDDLIAALLAQKRLLEGECKTLKRKRDELEKLASERNKAEEERRKRIASSVEGKGDDGETGGILGIGGEGGLDALIKSLLEANDSTIAANIVKPKTTSLSTGIDTEATAIPSARPLPPPSDPSHPLYRTWCPLTFTSHTVTILPSSEVPQTDPPKTFTHHVLKGHTPHQLLFFRFEFDVARPTPGAGAREGSTIVDFSATAISSHAQPELSRVLGVARQRRDLLLALTVVAEYYRLAVTRAEGMRVLWGLYMSDGKSAGGVEIVRPVDYTRRRAGLGKGRGKDGKKKRRGALLPFLGEREMLFRGNMEMEMLLSWGLEVDEVTGVGRSVVDVEVVVPGGGKKKKTANSRALVAGLKREVETVFGELLVERGVVGAVKAVVGVLFNVERRLEEEEEEEEDEDQQEEDEGTDRVE